MNYRKLGNSGLLVSEIALGTMIFGEKSERSTPPEEARSIIHRFLDEGGNHIDTADVYAGGRSEEIVGQAIKGRRDQVVLATKVRFLMGEGPNDQGLSRYHIMKGVEDSLRRLDTETIDLLYMHCWDPLTPIAESLRAFDDLVASGKVRYIGVSNFKSWQLMKALSVSDANGWARFVAAQYQYSLVKRDIEKEFSDLCQSEGVGITPWGPLGGGFLTGKYQRGKPPKGASEGRIGVTPDESEEAWHRRNTEQNWAVLEVIGKVAGNHKGTTVSQIAVAWLLAQPAVASVIVGVRTMDQLEDNLGATALQLQAEEIAELNQVSAMEEGYPYRFLKHYGARKEM
jgi:aryl-alcohol dehydrogenase-like predicted oxidoreductase